MKKIFLSMTVVAGLLLSGCSLDFFPSDELNSDALLQDEAGAEYIMDGCYAMLKDEVEYVGYASGNTYVRHYTQLAEFPADNVCLAGKTTDPLYEALAYMMTDNLKNVSTLWMLAYKVIYMSNTVIETLEKKDLTDKQLLGEAYYMRALMHLHMVTLYAKPYSQGTDNMGVPLMTSTASATTREPVGKVYEQIVADLKLAAQYMGKSRGNAGYPSHDAALGLLSRVYLYMGMNNEVISTVEEMLNGATPESKLDPDLANYFANAKTSSETLFCVAHELVDDKKQSSAGSMYNGDGGGWGEIYPSDPLLYLYERYPSDVRYTAFIKPQFPETVSPDYNVYFPDPETPDDASGRQNIVMKVTPSGDNFTFQEDGKTYTVEKRTVQGEYSEYHVMYKDVDCLARVSHPMTNRYNYPKWFVTKFGYQDGSPTLSSPVFSRWGEVILNRAEAYAKLGQDQKALDDVNVIRKRAGIPAEVMFSTTNMHGYATVFDVVMDERRLELAFEGYRMFDVYRNNMEMDRRYPGAQPWAIVKPDYNHIQYPIPNAEWTVSGIQQNPGY